MKKLLTSEEIEELIKDFKKTFRENKVLYAKTKGFDMESVQLRMQADYNAQQCLLEISRIEVLLPYTRALESKEKENKELREEVKALKTVLKATDVSKFEEFVHRKLEEISKPQEEK